MYSHVEPCRNSRKQYKRGSSQKFAKMNIHVRRRQNHDALMSDTYQMFCKVLCTDVRTTMRLMLDIYQMFYKVLCTDVRTIERLMSIRIKNRAFQRHTPEGCNTFEQNKDAPVEPQVKHAEIIGSLRRRAKAKHKHDHDRTWKISRQDCK